MGDCQGLGRLAIAECGNACSVIFEAERVCYQTVGRLLSRGRGRTFSSLPTSLPSTVKPKKEKKMPDSPAQSGNIDRAPRIERAHKTPCNTHRRGAAAQLVPFFPHLFPVPPFRPAVGRIKLVLMGTRSTA